MASIKVKFRPSTVADKEGTVYFQIIHGRKVRQLLSGYHLLPSEWDNHRSMVNTHNSNIRRPLILTIRQSILNDTRRLSKIVSKFDNAGLAYTADDIIDEFNRHSSQYTLFRFMETLIDSLKQNGNIRTSETYKATLNSFRKFRQDKDIMLDSITPDIMEAYEAWHKSHGVTPNTISFYTRILRAVYNRAIEQEIIESRNPFRHVYTGVEKTVKRALPLPIIKKINTLDLSLAPSLDFARDMFMLSFYLRGMSFIDMAYLRKADLCNGHVSYRRRKTGQLLFIEWTSDMQLILDKYPENESEYLLPIIRVRSEKERTIYRNVSCKINRNLRQVASMLNLNLRLTMYVARHSWASAAKTIGIPLSVISEGMGHDCESTTRIYLASLDTTVVDKANARILKSLK